MSTVRPPWGGRAPRLMLVVTAGDVEARPGVIAAALRGGIDALQLRDPGVGGGALQRAALVLRRLTDAAGALLLVNDRVDVALAAAADGVHLPAASWPIAAARQLLAGHDTLVGRSTHAAADVAAAAREGADYVVLGPVFATPSKAAYGPPVSPEVLVEAAAVRLGVPVLAIGGVTAAQVPDLVRRGAHGVAVIRAVLDASDPEAAARALAAALG